MKVIVVEFYLFIDVRKWFDKIISIITMVKLLPIIIWLIFLRWIQWCF